MAASMWQVGDELWDVVVPLVAVHEPDPRGGRPRVDDRVCFGAIMFVLFTGRCAGRSAGLASAPSGCLADRGHDFDKYRRALWDRGVKPVIARRGSEHGSGLGRQRFVVERTFAHPHNLRRLRTRYERNNALHLAFMLLGCAVFASAG